MIIKHLNLLSHALLTFYGGLTIDRPTLALAYHRRIFLAHFVVAQFSLL